jgi:hypothetical protein
VERLGPTRIPTTRGTSMILFARLVDELEYDEKRHLSLVSINNYETWVPTEALYTPEQLAKIELFWEKSKI